MMGEPPGTDRKGRGIRIASADLFQTPDVKPEEPSDEWASLSFTRAISSTLDCHGRGRAAKQEKQSQGPRVQLVPGFHDVMIVDSSLAHSCPVIFWRRRFMVS